MHGCRKCDWDQCSSCKAKAEHSEPTTISLVGAPRGILKSRFNIGDPVIVDCDEEPKHGFISDGKVRIGSRREFCSFPWRVAEWTYSVITTKATIIDIPLERLRLDRNPIFDFECKVDLSGAAGTRRKPKLKVSFKNVVEDDKQAKIKDLELKVCILMNGIEGESRLLQDFEDGGSKILEHIKEYMSISGRRDLLQFGFEHLITPGHDKWIFQDIIAFREELEQTLGVNEETGELVSTTKDEAEKDNARMGELGGLEKMMEELSVKDTGHNEASPRGHSSLAIAVSGFPTLGGSVKSSRVVERVVD